MGIYCDCDSKAELKQAIQKGEIPVFELANIEGEHPEWVDDALKQECYKKELEFFIKRLPFYNKFFTASLSCIRDADDTIKYAKKLGYKIDSSLLVEAVEPVVNLALKNLTNSLWLQKYFNNSDIDFSNYQKGFEEALPKLAEEHAEYWLKEARRTAKRFRGTRKTTRYWNKFNICLEELNLVKDFGIYPNGDIEEIKDIAFSRGVSYFLEEANKLPKDDPRKLKYENVAQRNAELLEREIPPVYTH